MDPETRRAKTIETFNTVSTGYDNPSLRFFQESARHMATYLSAEDIRHVLDVATGTGNLALEIARTFPAMHVIGIDFSSGMLAKARAKAEREGIKNAAFVEMDMDEIAFPDGHFDAAVCAFGIFFVEDMTGQLRHMTAKVRPGGKIVISCFYEDFLQPLVGVLARRLQQYGIEKPPRKWRLIETEAKCEALFRDAGLKEIRVERKDIGYYLEGPSEWWDVVWNAAFRTQLSQLAPDDLRQFKEEHLKEIAKFRRQEGIWLNVKVLYTTGISP